MKVLILVLCVLNTVVAYQQIAENTPICMEHLKEFHIKHNPRTQDLNIFMHACNNILVHEEGFLKGFDGIIHFPRCNKTLLINSFDKRIHNGYYVPGTLKGYEAIYNSDPCKTEERRVQWADIFEPLIKLVSKGWLVEKRMKNYYHGKKGFKIINMNKKYLKVKRRQFIKILKNIQSDGPSSSLYKKGSELLNKFMDFFKKKNTTYPSEEDFMYYQVSIENVEVFNALEDDITIAMMDSEDYGDSNEEYEDYYNEEGLLLYRKKTY